MMKNLVRSLDPRWDAIDLLKADHRRVEALFSEFKDADDKRTQNSLAKQICAELDVHAKLEEKLLYPKARREVKAAKDEVEEGMVEHEGIKRLVKQLSAMNASDELFEARMTVLEEYVKHHVKEEESSMFPKIAEGDLDLQALGEKLEEAKHRLQPPRRATRRSNGTHVEAGAG